jgi:hypothetical protein
MTTSLAPSPGKPLTDVSRMGQNQYRFTLYFRQGRNPHPQFTFFDYPSKDMKLVVERAKRFCEQMSYRFVNVQPSVIDLDKEEAINRGDEAR